MSRVNVTFPGNVRVTALVDGFEVKTDQPTGHGGESSAPSPYDLFLASIATCAGFYVKSFCDKRQLSTEGLGLTLDIDRNTKTRRLDKVRIVIQLPQGFPDKYKRAIVAAAEMCSVKNALTDPPEFETMTKI